MDPSERELIEAAFGQADPRRDSRERFGAAGPLRQPDDTEEVEFIGRDDNSTSEGTAGPADIGERRNSPDELTPTEAAMTRAPARALVLRQGAAGAPGPTLRACFDAALPRHDALGALRTELLLLHEGRKHSNVVPVLSAESGEGRSQLAAELAVCFAQLGRSTLLVDADLRSPMQHVMFNVSAPFGLAEAIEQRGKPLLHSISQLPKMYLCPAGTATQNPLDLLSEGHFMRLLSEWSRAYEFIVIDTPPALRYADSLAIASIVRRVLYLARTQHTSMKAASELLRRLEATRANVLGAVMQDF
jgi:capsular exopolysaccharide synthesis family protein